MLNSNRWMRLVITRFGATIVALYRLVNYPRQRRLAYEMFQAILQRCKHPAVRFSLVDTMF